MKSNFERKFGKYAIKNLTIYLIGAYVLGYLIQLINPTVFEFLLFNPYHILHGQVWRLFTWVFMPPSELNIFTIIMLMLYYNLGTQLERTWGTFKYNMYLFSGFIFTIIGTFIAYAVMTGLFGNAVIAGDWCSLFVSTYYINMSIFLAFAVTFPNMELMLYFILPIKMKWLGILYGALILVDVYKIFTAYSQTIIGIMPAIAQATVIVMSLLNFVLFWVTGQFKVNYVRGASKRKREYKQKVSEGYKRKTYENGAMHKCAICGRTEVDSPELTFRYCSKCTGGKEYCNDHLFTHQHK